MDEETAENLVELMDEETGGEIRLIQSYDEDEIGSRMTTNYVVINDYTCDVDSIEELEELVRRAGL